MFYNIKILCKKEGLKLYNFINNLAHGNQKIVSGIEGLILIILFHLVWVIYSFFEKKKKKKNYDESIQRILYYKTFTFVMCICLGLIIGT